MSAPLQFYGETPGASAPPPRPPSRTSSQSSTGSMRGSPPTLHSRGASIISSPRAYRLDEEVPGQQRLEEINAQLKLILEELTNYNQQIGNIKLGIERNADNYESLKLLNSQIMGLQSTISETQIEYHRQMESFKAGDRENGFAWTKSHEWDHYETYTTTCSGIDELLLQIQLPEMPRFYLEQQIQELQEEKARLRQQPPPKACCIIL